MTFILLTLTAGLTLLLAGHTLRRRAEDAALARVKCQSESSKGTTKDPI